MPYATEEDVIARYGDDAYRVASDRDRNGESDSQSWATALEDASAMIDLYVGKRYDLALP